MNTSYKLLAATSVGILIGAFGISITNAQPKSPAYLVAEFEVTDPAGWKTYVDGARANPSGTFIVRAAKGTSLAGSAPKTITIVKFNSLEEAVAFDSSASYSALKPMRDKSSNWRSYVVEGLQN
jgi:uncharacterized protein (DUF1330 family)